MQLAILRKGQIWAPHPHGGVTSVIRKTKKNLISRGDVCYECDYEFTSKQG